MSTFVYVCWFLSVSIIPVSVSVCVPMHVFLRSCVHLFLCLYSLFKLVFLCLTASVCVHVSVSVSVSM